MTSIARFVAAMMLKVAFIKVIKHVKIVKNWLNVEAINSIILADSWVFNIQI